MEHKLIKTENYLLIVSNEDIKANDCYLSPSGIWFYNHLNPNHIKACKKVIAHLPLNNAPYLEGVDVLPKIGNDVEKLAIEEVGVDGKIYNEIDHTTFIKGYNKAKEKYTQELFFILDYLVDKMDGISQEQINKDSFQLGRYRTFKYMFEYIKSIQQPKLPIAFESEAVSDIPSKEVMGEFDARPKTKTNSQGRTEWVGSYKY